MEFNEKNLVTILFIILFSTVIIYWTYINHIKNNFLEKESYYKRSKIYTGYLWGIGGNAIAIFQIIKWLIQYINRV